MTTQIIVMTICGLTAIYVIGKIVYDLYINTEPKWRIVKNKDKFEVQIKEQHSSDFYADRRWEASQENKLEEHSFDTLEEATKALTYRKGNGKGDRPLTSLERYRAEKKLEVVVK